MKKRTFTTETPRHGEIGKDKEILTTEATKDTKGKEGHATSAQRTPRKEGARLEVASVVDLSHL